MPIKDLIFIDKYVALLNAVMSWSYLPELVAFAMVALNSELVGKRMAFLYFAYGSNMLSSRLMARCPSATKIGTAIAEDYSLEFSKLSKDTSGKATLIKSTGQKLQTQGVLFKIEDTEKLELDLAEGASGAKPGYVRVEDFSVQRDRKTVTALTYLALAPRSNLKPFDWYLALVVAGAMEHGFDEEHVNNLRATPYDLDRDTTRDLRRYALQALVEHGYVDYTTLLNAAN